MKEIDLLFNLILKRDRVALGRAISLIESSLDSDRIKAVYLLKKCFGLKKESIRIGVSGPPGVGKSTFINVLGQVALKDGKSVAVLAIDPSSKASGGSILGDKTRMAELSRSVNAFIRPSPTRGFLGGTGRKTRESLVLLEAAGFDLILIETVGVGQSEDEVRTMVDLFLLLTLPNSGDELQGIKRGIMESADFIIVNKAEESNQKESRAAVSAHRSILSLLPKKDHRIETKVYACSSLNGDGVDSIYVNMLEFMELIRDSLFFKEQRKQQYSDWLDNQVQERLLEIFEMNKKVRDEIQNQKELILSGKSDPVSSAELIISKYFSKNQD